MTLGTWDSASTPQNLLNKFVIHVLITQFIIAGVSSWRRQRGACSPPWLLFVSPLIRRYLDRDKYSIIINIIALLFRYPSNRPVNHYSHHTYLLPDTNIYSYARPFMTSVAPVCAVQCLDDDNIIVNETKRRRTAPTAHALYNSDHF